MILPTKQLSQVVKEAVHTMHEYLHGVAVLFGLRVWGVRDVRPVTVSLLKVIRARHVLHPAICITKGKW